MNEIDEIGDTPLSEMDLPETEMGWPGDGSGEDDLADFNANETNDYLNE